MLHTFQRGVGAARYLSRRTASTQAWQLSPNHSIYVSNSDDPFFNLSLEDWLFRHKSPKDPLLLLYRDKPCVVIGRNQNPWKEVNMRAVRRTGVPFIRRRSGGGTVYHDLGNTNFSIHLPRTSFDRHATAQVVLGAVRSLGIDANVNVRNDICVGTHNYVSGSAYKIVNNRAYHHGTMLISTRLDLLGDLLHANKDSIDTKGVASIRSPVRNLRHYDASVDHSTFVDAVVSAFCREYEIEEQIFYVDDDVEIAAANEFIRHGIAELLSWDWAYGQTPEFTQDIQEWFGWGNIAARIHSKHGIILSCEFRMPDTLDATLRVQLEALANRLQQQRYGFLDDRVLQHAADERLRDVLQWLKAETDC